MTQAFTWLNDVVQLNAVNVKDCEDVCFSHCEDGVGLGADIHQSEQNIFIVDLENLPLVKLYLRNDADMYRLTSCKTLICTPLQTHASSVDFYSKVVIEFYKNGYDGRDLLAHIVAIYDADQVTYLIEKFKSVVVTQGLAKERWNIIINKNH